MTESEAIAAFREIKTLLQLLNTRFDIIDTRLDSVETRLDALQGVNGTLANVQ